MALECTVLRCLQANRTRLSLLCMARALELSRSAPWRYKVSIRVLPNMNQKVHWILAAQFLILSDEFYLLLTDLFIGTKSPGFIFLSSISSFFPYKKWVIEYLNIATSSIELSLSQLKHKCLVNVEMLIPSGELTLPHAEETSLVPVSPLAECPLAGE